MRSYGSIRPRPFSWSVDRPKVTPPGTCPEQRKNRCQAPSLRTSSFPAQCGRQGSSDQAILDAAEQAYASSFIRELPEGFETLLGERGVSLSGGQRQRIAIARAFVRNAPILILDEATAALDAASEAEVQQAIDRLAKERTVICIAHRLSTLKAMDRIIVLSHGSVIEDGSFDQLMNLGGTFAAMAQRQGMHSVSSNSTQV